MANDTAEVDRGGARVLRAHRPAQHLHQDPGHRRGRAGNRGDDRRRNQRERHAALLAANYEAIHEAYIRGLERRVEAGKPITTSTPWRASSSRRVDTAVDAQLPEDSPLRGKAAVANAKLAYQRFARSPAPTAGGRWRRRARTCSGRCGRRPGRRTRTTRDVLYVDELIGPDCVNTMPEGTIAAFLDHGNVRRTVDEDVDGADALLEQVEAAGVSMDAVTAKLETDGVGQFSESFDSLIAHPGQEHGGLACPRRSLSSPRRSPPPRPSSRRPTSWPGCGGRPVAVAAATRPRSPTGSGGCPWSRRCAAGRPS